MQTSIQDFIKLINHFSNSLSYIEIPESLSLSVTYSNPPY
jgi:hypothetical protein